MAIAPSDFRFSRPDKAWPESKQSRSSELSSECEQELEHRLVQAARIRGLLALLLMEVEQSKLVKNPNGDAAGNALLSEFFLMLMKKVPAAAGAARFGEKEFALMLPNVDATVGLRLARELKKELENTRFAVGKPPEEVRLAIGVGVAVYPHDSTSALGLLEAASLALAEAKRDKNDGVALYFGAKNGGSPYGPGKITAGTRATVSRKDISPPSFARAGALSCGELDLISASLHPPTPAGPGRTGRSEVALALVEASLQTAPGSAAPAASRRFPGNAGEGRRQTAPADAALQILDHVEREIEDGYGGPATARAREAHRPREQRPGRPHPQEPARAGDRGDEFQLICASLDPAAELRDHPANTQPSLPPSLRNEGFQPFPNSPPRNSPPPRRMAAAAAAGAAPAPAITKPAPQGPERSAHPRPVPPQPAVAQAAPPQPVPSQLPVAADPGQQQKPLAETQEGAGSSTQAAGQPKTAAGETTAQSGTRREQRLRAAFPVRVSGMDSNGKMFEDGAATIDITTTGARLSGITQDLQRGYILEVKHRSHRARYVVKWVGEKGTVEEGQAGLQLIDQGKLIWGRALPRVLGDQPTVRRLDKSHEE